MAAILSKSTSGIDNDSDCLVFDSAIVTTIGIRITKTLLGSRPIIWRTHGTSISRNRRLHNWSDSPKSLSEPLSLSPC